jgi:putative hydrolase of the HAD superfamily
MKIVFDFGGVLFSWHPVAMLQREIPHVAHNAAEAVHWVAQIFQGYTGDWGDFDRGAVQIPELVQRIASAPAWPRRTCRPWWTA